MINDFILLKSVIDYCRTSACIPTASANSQVGVIAGGV